MGVEHEPDRRSAGDPARPRFKVCGPMVDQVTDAGVRARLWPGRSLPVDDVLPLYVGYGRSSPESVRKINDDRQYAPATLRNRDLILDVLRDVLPMTGAILESQAAQASTSSILWEISRASFSNLSDPDPDALPRVAAWVKAISVTNVRGPIALDASHSAWPRQRPTRTFASTWSTFHRGKRP